jgi:hypothetical protein
LCEVPDCDFHHIGGICCWYLRALDKLGGLSLHRTLSLPSIRLLDGDIWFGGVSFILGWMIMLASLVVFSPMLTFDHSLAAHLMVMEHAISSWCGVGILFYLEGAHVKTFHLLF